MDAAKVIGVLSSFMTVKDGLGDPLKSVNNTLHKTFMMSFEGCFTTKKLDKEVVAVESILDYLHDELNTGHWSEIPLEIRQAFTATSFIKTVLILKQSPLSVNLLQEALKILDMGLLLGAPLPSNPELLTKSATFISKQLCSVDKSPIFSSSHKRETPAKPHSGFDNIKGITVDSLSCPSLQKFNNDYFTTKKPVKLLDCTSHWPAMTKWVDLNYLIEVAGERTVPIEVGSHYASEEWSQKLMTLKDFMKSYFLEHLDGMGYLAQHNLFDQIPELKNDICIPDYCCLSDDDNEDYPDINAWLGPAHTVSPLHHDPKNNILVQVFGSKQLIMFPPSETPYLYPHETNLLSNTAQVDPLNPNLEMFPNFRKAIPYKCVLQSGEMLYIPPKWWHHVTALEKSFSVSFWWN